MIKPVQSVNDIMTEILAAHKFFSADYDKIAARFGGGSIKTVARRLFDFCKRNIEYKIESDGLQSTKSPAAILKFGKTIGGDCKHYASFINGVLDALNRTGRYDMTICYRFASYKIFDNIPEHVFAVVIDEDGKEIWIDPVLENFDSRSPQPTATVDRCVAKNKKAMPLVRISGTNSDNGFQSVNVVSRADALKNCYSEPKGLGYIVPSDDGSSPTGGSYAPNATPPVVTVTPVPMPSIPVSPSNKIPGLQFFQAELTVDPTTGRIVPVNESPLELPIGPAASLPDVIRAQYPATWLGKTVPAQLPKPLVIGNRLVLWPKIYDWNVIRDDAFFWLRFLTIMMTPLVKAYSIKPNDWFVDTGGDHTEEDTVLGHTILFDMDNADTVDYITNMPTIVPTNSAIVTGVRYLVNGKDFVFPERVDGLTPAAPPKIDVVYPSTYLGQPIPANFPKPVWVSGKIQLLPKGMDWNILKANNYFWLSFLTSVFVPIVEAYAQHNYATWNNKLAERILYDLDLNDPIDNYLIDPPDELNLFQKIFKAIGNVVESVGKGLIKFVGLIPRQAFLLLVRLNVHSFATGLDSRIQVDAAKVKSKWEDIGGEYSSLLDAVNHGKDNKPILGVNERIGELTVAAAIAAAAPVIAAMAALLSAISPGAKTVVDDAIRAVNVMLTAAGEDPLAVGAATGTPVTIPNPYTPTGSTTITPPASNTTKIFDWIKANPVVAAAGAAALGYAVYLSTKKRR